jgi:hypothetical protein
MAGKIQKGMSDKGTLRDPSKMANSNRSVWYTVIALVVLGVAGLAIYSGSDTPPTPTTTTTQ